VGDLIGAHRHVAGPVDQDVGRLQQRIAEKAVRRQIAVVQLCLLILVAGHPLEPADRGDHRQQQMQLRVLRHLRLHEQRGGPGIDPGRQPVHHRPEGVLLDVLRVLVVGGERVPVGDEEVALVFVLQLHPVLQHTMIMTQVQPPGGAHAGQNPTRNRYCSMQQHTSL
jgi:hypothetical protein